jgi:hypothetical protein
MLLNDQGNHESMGGDGRLDALFLAYREACPDPEASPDFMPRLWQKIEARERVSVLFGRLSRNLVTAALALTIMMAVALSVMRLQNRSFYNQTYVEVLAADHLQDNLDNFAPVHVEPISDTGYQR